LSKYNAKKTEVDGIIFASRKEADYYKELKLRQKAGEIKEIVLQPKFCLLEKFRDKVGVLHRPIYYIADFEVLDANGATLIIDTKGMQTQVYKIKKKLFLSKYPDVNFKEV
jgi:hypothetical protein